MDKRTAQQLAPAAVPLLQLAADYYLENKKMEQRGEIELQKAEARAEQLQGLREVQQRQPQIRNDRQTAPETIEQMKAETDCSFCHEILDSIATLPQDRREMALAEYGRFQNAIEDGAAQDDLEDVLRETDQLRAVIEEELKVFPE